MTYVLITTPPPPQTYGRKHSIVGPFCLFWMNPCIDRKRKAGPKARVAGSPNFVLYKQHLTAFGRYCSPLHSTAVLCTVARCFYTILWPPGIPGVLCCPGRKYLMSQNKNEVLTVRDGSSNGDTAFLPSCSNVVRCCSCFCCLSLAPHPNAGD